MAEGIAFEELTVRSADGYALNVRVYGREDPKAAVLFIHGMGEHQGRYAPFASFLRENGYAAVTADLRGHGKNAPKPGHIADRNGAELLIGDEKALLATIWEHFPRTPVYLFAHSLGTIIARKLLQTHSGAFEKAVLAGYPNPRGAAKAATLLADCLSAVKGKDSRSALIDSMATGGFSKAVKDAETPSDWLSVNRENVRKYLEDPLCGVPFTLGSYDAMFRLLSDIGRPSLYRDVHADMPILLIAGEEDPCVGGEKERADSLDRLTRAGFRNIRVENLPGMRHEILNETDRDSAYRKILAFFDE